MMKGWLCLGCHLEVRWTACILLCGGPDRTGPPSACPVHSALRRTGPDRTAISMSCSFCSAADRTGPDRTAISMSCTFSLTPFLPGYDCHWTRQWTSQVQLFFRQWFFSPSSAWMQPSSFCLSDTFDPVDMVSQTSFLYVPFG
jgi:hypothetical protein